jgi:hypothetical protein
MIDERFEKFLAVALKRRAETPQAEEAAVERVLERLNEPLPRQKLSLRRWPSALLDWQFAPAWPRVAALACCAALGFYVGIAGLDRHWDPIDGPYSFASRADLGSIVFEPEPLTGARP